MTSCLTERKVQLNVCVHLFRHIRRHSVLSSFNCNLFSIFQMSDTGTCIKTEMMAS